MTDSTNLAAALLAFQADAPPIHLDATNPHFKNKYASLGGVVAAVRPALNKHGLVYTQLPTHLDGQPALRTVLMHAESGQALEDTMPLILSKQDSQAQGSALTYGRRYALLSILGLVGDDDDDANQATFRQPDQREPDPHGLRAARADADTADDPALVRVHFGTNSGKTLGELAQKQRKWYAEEWQPDTAKYPLKPEDTRLRRAARLLSGLPVPEDAGSFAVTAPGGGADDDIPFQRTFA